MIKRVETRGGHDSFIHPFLDIDNADGALRVDTSIGLALVGDKQCLAVVSEGQHIRQCPDRDQTKKIADRVKEGHGSRISDGICLNGRRYDAPGYSDTVGTAANEGTEVRVVRDVDAANQARCTGIGNTKDIQRLVSAVGNKKFLAVLVESHDFRGAFVKSGTRVWLAVGA